MSNLYNPFNNLITNIRWNINYKSKTCSVKLYGNACRIVCKYEKIIDKYIPPQINVDFIITTIWQISTNKPIKFDFGSYLIRNTTYQKFNIIIPKNCIFHNYKLKLQNEEMIILDNTIVADIENYNNIKIPFNLNNNPTNKNFFANNFQKRLEIIKKKIKTSIDLTKKIKEKINRIEYSKKFISDLDILVCEANYCKLKKINTFLNEFVKFQYVYTNEKKNSKNIFKKITKMQTLMDEYDDIQFEINEYIKFEILKNSAYVILLNNQLNIKNNIIVFSFIKYINKEKKLESILEKKLLEIV